MGWIVFLIFSFVAFVVLMNLSKKNVINKIGERVVVASKLLELFKESGFEASKKIYNSWFRDSNPEELWLKILAHTHGNKKLLGELGGKMWSVCEAISQLTELEKQMKVFLESGHIKFEDVFSGEIHEGVDMDELSKKYKNLVAIIDQFFVDIKKNLSV